MNANNNIFIPYTFRETRNGIESVSMPSDLFRNRRLFLIGEIDSTSMGVLMQSLMCLENLSDEPIELYINSPGGDVHSGLGVYRYITEQMRSPLHTFCIGSCASMAVIIYLAGDERYIYDGTELMIHDPASISGTFEKPDALRERLGMLENVKDTICRIIADRTDHDIEDIAEVTKKDTYFGADKALEFGLSTQIIGKEKM